VKADKVMSNAKEEAVRIKAHAHEEAEKQIADARTQAERVLSLSLSLSDWFLLPPISKEIGADFWMLWNFVSAGETKLGEGIDLQFFADNLNIDMLAMGLELGLIDCNFALLCFVLLVDNS
jgi:hypothetical protein